MKKYKNFQFTKAILLHKKNHYDIILLNILSSENEDILVKIMEELV